MDWFLWTWAGFVLLGAITGFVLALRERRSCPELLGDIDVLNFTMLGATMFAVIGLMPAFVISSAAAAI